MAVNRPFQIPRISSAALILHTSQMLAIKSASHTYWFTIGSQAIETARPADACQVLYINCLAEGSSILHTVADPMTALYRCFSSCASTVGIAASNRASLETLSLRLRVDPKIRNCVWVPRNALRPTWQPGRCSVLCELIG